MRISSGQLKRIRVETQSGQYLGRVSGFELETDSGIIEKYEVKTRIGLAGIWDSGLIISRSQIIFLDKDKMIVEDNVIKIKSELKDRLAKVGKLESTEPVISAEKS
ncbi:MAG: hypothetical protein NTZ49_05420 [Candidatus Parcubacteria bacterium]|nr:hypothetical protein [Candidatus Parcubacteria bacterium]